MSVDIEMYSSNYCPYCMRARHLLQQKQVTFNEIIVDSDAQLRRTMEQRSGRHTVPQIFIAGKAIGGCDELYALERQGQLDSLLAGR